MKKSLIAIVVLALLVGGCSAAPKTQQSFAMDTVINQTVYTRNDGLIAQNVQTINQLEQLLSKTLENSDISRLNKTGHEQVDVRTAVLLEECLIYAELTDGAFNPAMGGVMQAWGFGTQNARVPTQAQLDALLQNADWQSITVLGDKINTGGTQIDLGGAAKGYALDVLRGQLKEENADAALIALGGSICAYGEKPDGGGWVIGIRNPTGDAADYVATLTLRDECVSTSGAYERGFEQNGQYYHHIIDPKTGHPVQNGLLSVTVADENGLLTDVMSTALFVMGLQDGLAFAQENEIAAVFITDENEIYTTEGFGREFTIEDSAYHAAETSN